jgi:hypothetical protein
MGYESFFTMFPQLWINEIEGKIFEDQSRNCYQLYKLTLFEKKFKYFFCKEVMPYFSGVPG